MAWRARGLAVILLVLLSLPAAPPATSSPVAAATAEPADDLHALTPPPMVSRHHDGPAPPDPERPVAPGPVPVAGFVIVMERGDVRKETHARPFVPVLADLGADASPLPDLEVTVAPTPGGATLSVVRLTASPFPLDVTAHGADGYLGVRLDAFPDRVALTTRDGGIDVDARDAAGGAGRVVAGNATAAVDVALAPLAAAFSWTAGRTPDGGAMTWEAEDLGDVDLSLTDGDGRLGVAWRRAPDAAALTWTDGNAQRLRLDAPVEGGAAALTLVRGDAVARIAWAASPRHADVTLQPTDAGWTVAHEATPPGTRIDLHLGDGARALDLVVHGTPARLDATAGADGIVLDASEPAALLEARAGNATCPLAPGSFIAYLDGCLTARLEGVTHLEAARTDGILVAVEARAQDTLLAAGDLWLRALPLPPATRLLAAADDDGVALAWDATHATRVQGAYGSTTLTPTNGWRLTAEGAAWDVTLPPSTTAHLTWTGRGRGNDGGVLAAGAAGLPDVLDLRLDLIDGANVTWQASGALTGPWLAASGADGGVVRVAAGTLPAEGAFHVTADGIQWTLLEAAPVTLSAGREPPPVPAVGVVVDGDTIAAAVTAPPNGSLAWGDGLHLAWDGGVPADPLPIQVTGDHGAGHLMLAHVPNRLAARLGGDGLYVDADAPGLSVSAAGAGLGLGDGGSVSIPSAPATWSVTVDRDAVHVAGGLTGTLTLGEKRWGHPLAGFTTERTRFDLRDAHTRVDVGLLSVLVTGRGGVSMDHEPAGWTSNLLLLVWQDGDADWGVNDAHVDLARGDAHVVHGLNVHVLLLHVLPWSGPLIAITAILRRWRKARRTAATVA